MQKTKKINDSDKLHFAKQELVQADAKLGWLSAVYILMISSMIAIGFGIECHPWKIIGPIMALPISSLLIVFYGLIPVSPDKAKGELNCFNEDRKKQSSTYEDVIELSFVLAKNKYLCCRLSTWYIYPIFWLIQKIINWKKP